MRELFKLSMRKEVLLLLPVFWASYFNQYYSSMNQILLPVSELTSLDFQTYYFGVRARALIGFVGKSGRPIFHKAQELY